MKKINVGIIGAGRIGKVHCKNIAYNIDEANILMIADIQIIAAKKCAEEFNIPEITDDYKDIIKNQNIDAVIVCSSTDTHAYMIKETAEAGKHIFCEKPIDFDLGKIDDALSRVEKYKVKLQIGFNRRFDHNFRKAKELIENGKIGKINTFKITSKDPSPPSLEYLKRSGGIFADMTIHDFDMARFLSGSEVREIYVTGGVLKNQVCKEAGDLDTAIIILKFINGFIGIIENSRSTSYGYDQRLEVFGTEGMISVGNELLDTVELTNSESTKKSLLSSSVIERYTNSYLEEMKEFIRCVIKDKNPTVSGIDGKMSIAIAMAAKLSFDNNRPVKMAEIL